MNTEGYRSNVKALRHVRHKNGYRIDVRTTMRRACYFDTHQVMHIVENNCKDDIMVTLYYFETNTDYLSPRMTMHISKYHSPIYVVKAGETRQLPGPEDVCDIKIKTVVDTKYKTVRSHKSSRMHKAFSNIEDGILTCYGIATNVNVNHSKCKKEGTVNFLPMNHPNLAELSDRIR